MKIKSSHKVSFLRSLGLLACTVLLSGCLSTAVGLGVGAVVVTGKVATTAVKVPVKVGAKAVGAAIPDGCDHDDEDDCED